MNALPPSVPKSIGATEQTGEDLIEIAEDMLEFHPKPGSMVANHHKERKRRELAERQAEQVAERVEERGYQAVKVTPVSPEVIRTIAITVSAGESKQVLPLAPYRKHARLQIATTGGSLILAHDQGAAISGQGYPLPAGQPFDVGARAQLWAMNPGGSSVQVGVYSELYAPEE